MTTMMNAVLGAVLSMAVGATAVAVPLETSPRPGEVRETASGREGTSGSPPPTAQPPIWENGEVGAAARLTMRSITSSDRSAIRWPFQ